ncbi:hypothetical protein RND71_010728 [Anisodus tanguticus]|uniref:Uncharacterized protein n=1 Tax=Anisodus tanguticus TaxID=243964 RepID=A0AAE1SKV7_9SOLA|nr:hypothetical protein RND71_010728 [Anisodus tanguticus]
MDWKLDDFQEVVRQTWAKHWVTSNVFHANLIKRPKVAIVCLASVVDKAREQESCENKNLKNLILQDEEDKIISHVMSWFTGENVEDDESEDTKDVIKEIKMRMTRVKRSDTKQATHISYADAQNLNVRPYGHCHSKSGNYELLSSGRAGASLHIHQNSSF